MKDQFIYCHKCGTRNFSDDKACGICKTHLVSQGADNKTIVKTNNYFFIAIIVGGLIFLYYNVFNKDKPRDVNVAYDKNLYQESPILGPIKSNSNDQGEKKENLKNSPEIDLSIINDETQVPDKLTIAFFTKLLASLQKRYINRSKRDIANALVAAHNIIIKAGETDSLLEFTTAFNAYSKEVNKKFNLSLEESLTLFIRISYQI